MTLPTNERERSAKRTLSDRPPTIRGSPLDRDTRRELAKLTATYLNGVAVAIFGVGSLTPAVTLLLVADFDSRSLLPIIGFGLIFMAISVGLHVAARWFRKSEYAR